MRAAILIFALTLTAHAQWTLQQSPTTADLRGIDNVGNGIAWASGTDGTILRTTDSGLHWQLCTLPPNAAPLDFRGIQAFDANTAIAMSSGSGDQSRLYKTTDACQTWTLLFTNPDKEGFFDAIAIILKSHFKTWRWAAKQYPMIFVLGDPVGRKKEFRIWRIAQNHKPQAWDHPPARKGEAAFAASNSVLLAYTQDFFQIATGGTSGAHLVTASGAGELGMIYDAPSVPVGHATESSGIFSVGYNHNPYDHGSPLHGVAVGGDYKAPDDRSSSAAYSLPDGRHWQAATTPPHGFRSAVAYDATTNTWITVGPNGTDISTDDGRNWHALEPSASEAPDTDQHWNALSLPYVVGPHGRIGILNPSALSSDSKAP